jgi:sigma-B regulation protein RsbU (phosphoserine phosphatase)
MTNPTADLAKELRSHACCACHGFLEPELVSVYPAAEVCLDCMPKAELRRLESDLNRVQVLDRSLLPELPHLHGLEVGLHYRPSRLLSGDFYDVSVSGPPDRLTLIVGDVMGKGIPAALLRTGLQASIRALCGEVASPGLVLKKANQHFMASSSSRTIASVFLGVMDPVAGRLDYASAGHLPPLIRKRSGEWQALEATGMVLGAFESAPYVERSVALEPGEVIVLYSDGITETENHSSGEFFDERRLCRVIDEAGNASAQSLATGVADALSSFSPGEPSDDRTLVIVRRS